MPGQTSDNQPQSKGNQPQSQPDDNIFFRNSPKPEDLERVDPDPTPVLRNWSKSIVTNTPESHSFTVLDTYNAYPTFTTEQENRIKDLIQEALVSFAKLMRDGG